MRIAVTGSIATDHLMVFPGRFADQFVAGQLDNVSLSFLVDELVVHRGGVAANIAFGLGVLGLRPALIGAVGADFADYRSWLERHGVDTESVHVSTSRHTARFLCTTDEVQNQIASFYAGAMTEARTISLDSVRADLVVVAPNDPEAMLRHTAECRARGLRFAADPSQQLARLDGAAIRSLVDGAKLLFTNEYESGLLLEKTGWTREEVLTRVGTWLTTLGPNGVRISSAQAPPIHVPAAPELRRADPTGVGDAFRAGFLAGLTWDLDHEQAAQLGCGLAVLALETTGTQEYALDPTEFSTRLLDAYGLDVRSRFAAVPV
ncbi:carbohydrate kinase family protein [Lentzea tibetensis]|uniref:Carbohydrate kinase family protein n=1 Tax=Lentzea tibetensis TaxID=2591470 RepID=A0A563EIY7_9PSEU|nr:carbohydrate kinase family protein [Lentzea tibetensis]TWP46688.1 carbohydrate kinase family protein [Lentzea tibetensis]